MKSKNIDVIKLILNLVIVFLVIFFAIMVYKVNKRYYFVDYHSRRIYQADDFSYDFNKNSLINMYEYARKNEMRTGTYYVDTSQYEALALYYEAAFKYNMYDVSGDEEMASVYLEQMKDEYGRLTMDIFKKKADNTNIQLGIDVSME